MLIFVVLFLQKSRRWRRANGCELPASRNMRRCTRVSVLVYCISPAGVVDRHQGAGGGGRGGERGGQEGLDH